MSSGRKLEVLRGDPERLGAKETGSGINFAYAVPQDGEAQLVLVSASDPKKELMRIPLKKEERVGDIGAIFINGASPEDLGYYYEVGGRHVLDPYAERIRGETCFVLPMQEAWREDPAPRIPIEDLMIYKLHVRGFTKKAKKTRFKGTFLGLTEMIPYIRDLGFNAVELMPIYEFDETLRIRPYTQETIEDEEGGARTVKAVPLKNYWGYAEKNYYFSPKALYAATEDSSKELQQMVQAFHAAGMEVIMEMYFPEKMDPFAAMLAIRFWKSRYRIDGFHFVGIGTPVDAIVRDPLLTCTKLLFEQVDAEWIYGGQTPSVRNILVCCNEFQNTARSFLKGDEGQLGDFARFLRRNPLTHGYVNFMANTNGFTLYDSVCYDYKHNEKNGEDNRDGPDWNCSWNCGVEGPSRKRQVRQLRMRQMKNALLYTFLAQGTPLLLAGDEGLNSQGGNNNAYASDDATGWTDWNSTKEAGELRHFTKELLAFRASHKVFHMPLEYKGTDYRSYGCPDISFHDSKAWVCSFEKDSHTLAVMYNGLYTLEEASKEGEYYYVAYNAFWDAHPFALPSLPADWRWYPLINSAAPAGEEFAAGDVEPCANQKYCEASPRSVVVLVGHLDAEAVKASKARSARSGKKRGSKRESKH